MVVVTTVVILLALLLLAGRVRTRQLAWTPFQHAARSLRPSPTVGERKAFDVFLSYKSEEAVLARQLTEQLVANGLTPWFAEYIIPISERARFLEAIDLGIQGSRFGLCLTNDEYFASIHCQHELRQMLLPQSCPASGVIEVKVDPRCRPPFEVPWAASLAFRTVSQTLRDLGDIAGFRVELPDEQGGDAAARNTFLANRGSYSLDLGGWEIGRARDSNAGGGDVRGPTFKRWCGSDLIWGHLIIGPQDPAVRRRPLPVGAFDDREYYEEALRFADFFFRTQVRQRCIGVHLLFLDGWSHVAVTTCTQSYSQVTMESRTMSSPFSSFVASRSGASASTRI